MRKNDPASTCMIVEMIDDLFAEYPTGPGASVSTLSDPSTARVTGWVATGGRRNPRLVPPESLSGLSSAKTLGEQRQAHRTATLSAVAAEELAADEAIARVDTVRRLEALAHHAWRSAAQLIGQ
jgi:hypothetical protein